MDDVTDAEVEAVVGVWRKWKSCDMFPPDDVVVRSLLEAFTRVRAGEDKVERACKVMRAAMFRPDEDIIYVQKSRAWEDLPPDSRAEWFRAMRAALEAIGAL